MHEIIHVVDGRAPHRATRPLEIEAVEERPLAAGYYFVLFPSGGRAGARRRGKRYFGPFATPSQARMLFVSARVLGLVDEHMLQAPITECRSVARYTAAANDCRTAPHPRLELRRMGRC